jgi:hypothetical protein
MPYDYRYRPSAKTMRLNPRILIYIALGLAGLVSILVLGANISGFSAAVDPGCVESFELVSTSQNSTFDYSYDVLSHDFEHSSGVWRSVVVLRNNETAGGDFAVRYIFSSASGLKELTQSKFLAGKEAKAFEFVWQSDDPGVQGSFFVRAPVGQSEKMVSEWVKTSSC